MKNLKFICAGIIFIVLVTTILIWMPKHTTQANPKSQPLTIVKLAMDWTPNTDHTGIYVAQAKGWYKKQGINLQILPYSADVSSNILISNDKADIGIGSIEDIVGEQAKNHPIVSIGAVLQHNTSGLIVLADSSVTRPKGLEGKIYGGYGSPFENTVVTDVIKKDGGTGTFKNVVLNTQAMQALETKKIDFVWVLAGWEVIQAKRDGFKTNFFPITSYGIPDSPTLAFIVTPQKIKQQSSLLKKFMTATSQGYEYARVHPKESAQTLIDNTPKGTFPDTGLVFESQTYVSTQYADPGQKWGIQNATAWHTYPQFMLSAGTITDTNGKPVSTMNFDALFTNQFLK